MGNTGNTGNKPKRNIKNVAKTIGKGALHGTGVLSNAVCRAGKGIVGNKNVRNLAAIGLTVAGAVALSNIIVPTAVVLELGSAGLSKLAGRSYKPAAAIAMMYGAGRALAQGATEIVGETAEAVFSLGADATKFVADHTKNDDERGV